MECGICHRPLRVGGFISRDQVTAEADFDCPFCKRKYHLELTVVYETNWTEEETKRYVEKARLS